MAALQILRSKLLDIKTSKEVLDRNTDRVSQIGFGQRGDKRRTIRVQANQVTDHIMGKTMSYKDYEKGNWNWK